ncbi:MAG: hypothetical protein QGG84_07355, partial [Rhodospirillales bacterium]|nr:hypothetical protein [Rhodospirillales bacterium]
DWYSAISCDAEQSIGTPLHLMTALKSSDDTVFLSIYAAHDALSDPMVPFLGGLLVHNSGENLYRGRYEHALRLPRNNRRKSSFLGWIRATL